MFNEGNQIHKMSNSGSGTVINYGSGSDFLTSYGSGYGSGSTSQKVTVPTVPVPVPQHCFPDPECSRIWNALPGSGMLFPDPDLDFLPIPDPGVKKAPDPGYGSATMIILQFFVDADSIIW